MWLDHCAQQGTDPLAITFDSLVEYRDEVRIDSDGVSAKTWNRDLSVLKWFAETAESTSAMRRIPERDWRALRLKDTSFRWVRTVDAAEYRRFRSVGLQALSGADGDMASGLDCGVKAPLRDALYADFLLMHGARRAEACHLTLLDLPERRPGRPVNIGYLPARICKWGSGRELEERVEWVDRL
jgi:integrase